LRMMVLLMEDGLSSELSSHPFENLLI